VKSKTGASKKNINKKEAEKRHKKVVKTVYVLAMVLAVLCVFMVVSLSMNHFRDDSYVAAIGDEKIYVNEFKQRINLSRSEVYSYFKNKYGVDDNPKFWTSTYGGEIPAQKAKEIALEKSKNIKVQQILAKKKGIKKDISYLAFLNDLKAENANRAQAVKEGRVIYGPVKYDENAYFEDTFAKMIIELKEKLAEDGDIKVSDEDIKNYYEEMKDVLYAEGASAIVRKIIVPYGVDGKEKAHTKIQEINKKLSSGESFEKLAKEYNPDDNTKGTFGEQEFNDRNRRYESSFDEVVREKALKLKKDEVSDIIDNGNSYMIIKCIENKDKKYTDLEEAKDDVRRKCIDKKYDEMVKKLSVDSKIRINKRVYKGVKVN
jgi:hypothetical protein